ncbi:MAG: energy transducer TonB [Acidobacteriota bacterium]|nr:energy transducer TonB [Acidobacteriota bacterium]
MFDKLVESTKSRQGKRAGRYFVVTTAVYALALMALGIGTVIGFHPALAEGYSLLALLPPPVPIAPALPAIVQQAIKVNAPMNVFAPPHRPVVIPDPTTVTSPVTRLMPTAFTNVGLPPGTGQPTGIFGGRTDGDPVPPPPEAKPRPTPDPTPTPEIKPPGTAKVSEGVLQGGAIRKPRPTYPAIAKAARASGPVQVVVTISEEGRVIEAYAASGHALLRAAAVEAARQWAFSPTTLSKVPVKVQGVLTFNFVLE